jgi:hypothetical protein
MLEHAVRPSNPIAGTSTSNCRYDFTLIGNSFFISLDTARAKATLIVSYDKLSRMLIARHVVGTRSRAIRVSTSDGHVRCTRLQWYALGRVRRRASVDVPRWTRRNVYAISGAAPDLNYRTSCRGSRGSASLPSLNLIVKPRASSPKCCRYDRAQRLQSKLVQLTVILADEARAQF